jgi:serine/threonine-protein kinase
MSFEAQFRRGEIVAGKFQILRVLGQGGMGVVYEANHVDLDRRVALKVMVRSADTHDDAVARFQREARASARLNSPHVAKVLDVGSLEQGAPYLVMELLDGIDLRALIGQQGKVPLADAVDYLLEACEALAEAHCNGIVHRDLKPANLFLATDAYGGKVVKLLDFGVSKILFGTSNADPQLTDTRSMMGSPAYMSPEQMRSARDVDHRTDIWSLGVVLFEMVTGATPWSSDSLGELLAQIANEPTPNVRKRLPSAPPELQAVIDRCLQKQRGARYQSVADLALALHPLGSQRAQATLERVLRIAGQSSATGVVTKVNAETTASASGTSVGSRSRSRSRRTVISLVFGALLVSSLGLFFVQRARARATQQRAQSEAQSATAEAARDAAGRVENPPRPPASVPPPSVVLPTANALIVLQSVPTSVATGAQPSIDLPASASVKSVSAPRATQFSKQGAASTGRPTVAASSVAAGVSSVARPAVTAAVPTADPMSIRR